MEEQEMLKQIERRVGDRHERDYAVYYCLSSENADNNDTTKGQLINISDSGLSFLADEKHTNGEQLEFVLEAPGLQTNGGLFITTGDSSDLVLMRTNGQVVWVKENKNASKFETGISFTSELAFQLTENE